MQQSEVSAEQRLRLLPDQVHGFNGTDIAGIYTFRLLGNDLAEARDAPE